MNIILRGSFHETAKRENAESGRPLVSTSLGKLIEHHVFTEPTTADKINSANFDVELTAEISVVAIAIHFGPDGDERRELESQFGRHGWSSHPV